MNTVAKRTILLLLMTCAPISWAALGTTTGKDPKQWQAGELNVIVATVRDVHKDEGDVPNRYQATLIPLATLAGRFDASLQPALPVRFYVGLASSSIADPPPRRATVIAVVAVGLTNGSETKPSNWILSDICTFMPGESALLVIKGLADPRIAETLKKIQDARAQSDADTARPAGGDAKEK